MSLIERLGRHTSIYAVAIALQRGTAFVLVPFYTRVLTPGEYGTIAIVTVLTGVLVVLLPMALHGAVTRFYFEYRDHPELLRQFVGTVLVGMLLSCIFLGGLLLSFGRPIFDWLLGAVPFWPYVAIGIATSAAMPFFQVVLGLFQVRGQPIRYGAISLAQFLTTLLLTLFLILGAGWGAAGALTATLASSLLFAAVGLLLLRHDFVLCLRLDLLRSALAYMLPQIPHSFAAQLLAASDRFLLNGLISLATVGVYNIATIFNLAIDVLAQSVNRAYLPLSMGAMESRDPEQLDQLRDAGTTIIVALCLVGSLLTIFSEAIIKAAVGEAFEGAAAYVPFLAFAGVASGIYYVFSNILFYDKRATRYLPLATLSAATVGLGLCFVLISAYGAVGAAISTMCAQVLLTVITAAVARRFEVVAWDYKTHAAIYLIAFSISVSLASFSIPGTIGDLAFRLCAWLALVCLLSMIAWRKPFHILALGAKIAGVHPTAQRRQR